MFPHLQDTLKIYEKESKDKVIANIPLMNILAIEPQVELLSFVDYKPNEKNVYPFLIREPDHETILAVDDDSSRKWYSMGVFTFSSWIRD